MAQQVLLSNEDYQKIATGAAKQKLYIEQILHLVVGDMLSSSLKVLPTTDQELLEWQFFNGHITNIPTRQPLAPEEREERRQLAQLFAGGKPASEMIIEDRRLH